PDGHAFYRRLEQGAPCPGRLLGVEEVRWKQARPGELVWDLVPVDLAPPGRLAPRGAAVVRAEQPPEFLDLGPDVTRAPQHGGLVPLGGTGLPAAATAGRAQKPDDQDDSDRPALPPPPMPDAVPRSFVRSLCRGPAVAGDGERCE